MDEDRFFKALANASRRQLLDRLREKSGLTLGELCEGHDMSLQARSICTEARAADFFDEAAPAKKPSPDR